ncbi:NADH-quinone oxidoreductase subunit A [Ignicoccus hospitalis]|uniref:NADH-ubiquinone/plastoquinone oxidoreductase, chain 3 n=1 Tax=Ignicoccus hospitalis (strain KIN4/I / DSM 18386 / JCM 14125) TaxID=453591 RepID=A8A9X4_IGNH4|nr:NADH-quinone oxidoreductase subunit A [Ignicoccus hospitalis]ABU81726.1 NADH-ubiquinone/plastoquinone oxidoreductase, chain 3 [Ignicoccus hospitalis KIN4/I]HIH89990.1 NADH-quinone oxidoreductase subunit A [Desulfurococcaceae archaeon]
MIEPGAVAFTVVAVAMVVGGLVEGASLLINKLLEDKTPPHPDKFESYECGELTIGDPQSVNYTVNFYPYLVAFFVAEVASILALAASGSPKPNTLIGIGLLYFSLVVGLVWLRKIGIMRWTR